MSAKIRYSTTVWPCYLQSKALRDSCYKSYDNQLCVPDNIESYIATKAPNKTIDII